MKRQFDDIYEEDLIQNDGATFKHVEDYFKSYCAKQYHRRSKGAPYWTMTVVGGINKVSKEPFLAWTDIYGTQFRNTGYVLTGLALHYCQVLFENNWKPDMTEQEARDLIEQSMKIMFLRDKVAHDTI